MYFRNVISFFDGISCAQLAMQRAGATYDNYYAVEIDKFAIKITQSNWPNTVQLGDITKLTELPDADIIFGGFPCQSHSVAGKQLGFDDLRGQLFFEMLK